MQAGGAKAGPRLLSQGQEVLFPAEHDGRGRPIPRPESQGLLVPGLALWLSARRFLEKPGVPAPAVFKDIYTPAVFAFQARLQCPAFGLIGGRCDFHRISWTVVENSKFGGILAISAHTAASTPSRKR
jgi:hypothetical protein